MPPRARARSHPVARPVALSDEAVALLRERLISGKKPRVMLLVDTALGAAGTTAAIVSFAEPAIGEFISIRLRDDVVPFSPSELSMPVRGRKSVPDLAPTAAALPLEPAAEPLPARPARLVAVPDEPPPSAVPSALAPEQPSPAAPAAAKSPGRRPARGGGLSVTLRFAGQAWTYESSRSGRRSAPRPLNLAAVRAFADRLDDPSLRRDLQGAIDVCRQQAQTRADTLRAELERVEVELAELEE